MGVVPYQSFGLDCELLPAPIEPAWITAGTPKARNAIVSRSADGSAYTMVWDCTAGAFDWTYDCDETVYVLEGSILLADAGNPVRRLQAGDAVFFPKGAKVSWVVEGHVRKLAFMRATLPAPVSIGLKVARRLRALSGAVHGRANGTASREPRLGALGSSSSTAG